MSPTRNLHDSVESRNKSERIGTPSIKGSTLARFNVVNLRQYLKYGWALQNRSADGRRLITTDQEFAEGRQIDWVNRRTQLFLQFTKSHPIKENGFITL